MRGGSREELKLQPKLIVLTAYAGRQGKKTRKSKQSCKTRDKGQGTGVKGQGRTRGKSKNKLVKSVKGKGKGQGTVRGWGRYGAASVKSSLLAKSLSTREMNAVGEGPGYHMLQRESGVTWCLFPV